MSSYRHQMGYTPTAKDLRSMEGGKLKISIDRSKGPKRGKVDVEADNVLGIKGTMKEIISALTGRDMEGSGPRPKNKKKK